MKDDVWSHICLQGWLHASEQVEDLSTVFIERAAGRGESSTFLSASQAHKGWKVGNQFISVLFIFSSDPPFHLSTD